MSDHSSYRLQGIRGATTVEANTAEQIIEATDELLRKLHEAKGYTSIETFAERELALGKGLASKLVRIPALFQADAAKALKLDALSRAIDAIDQAPQAAASRVAKLPLKPPR